jgi:hypothetical protein
MITFLRAVRTGRTDITRALDRIFADPFVLLDDGHLEAFRQEGHLDQLDSECQARLNLNETAIQHINDWPGNLKEDIRTKLVEAIESGLPVRFRWTISGEDEEDHLVQEEDGELAMTFRTPEDRIRAEGEDDIAINIGSNSV